MLREHSAQDFWDSKILAWEGNAYREGRLWGLPLRWRRRLFLELVGPALRGKTVFEMGCGSAALLDPLFSMGIRKYVGCDVSAVAIREAKSRVAELGMGRKVELLQGNVLAVTPIQADFTFSLGLLDWLDDEELDSLLGSPTSAEYLHSFSERRVSMSQLLHRAYTYCAYGHKNLGYVPRYRKARDIAHATGKATPAAPVIFRDGRMSFSTFAYRLNDGHSCRELNDGLTPATASRPSPAPTVNPAENP